MAREQKSAASRHFRVESFKQGSPETPAASKNYQIVATEAPGNCSKQMYCR